MYLYDAVIQITIYIICVPISGRSQRNVYTDSLQYNNIVLQCNETRENNIRTSTKELEVFIYFFSGWRLPRDNGSDNRRPDA